MIGPRVPDAWSVGATMQLLNDYRLSRFEVALSAVLDCSQTSVLGLDEVMLFQQTNYRVGQELAAAARQNRYEGLLVRSATGLPDNNLIVFPDLLKAESYVRLVDSVDPRMFVPTKQ